jgi:ABC-type multidrug transport system ATPase subunit
LRSCLQCQVDAATRRHLWGVISGSGGRRATVLTTHSMEEADALSDRIGIMVKQNRFQRK